MNMLQTIAQSDLQGFAKLIQFYDQGGVIMYLLTLCSLVSIAVIVYKAMGLSRERVLPETLKQSILQYATQRDIASAQSLAQQIERHDSVASRLGQVVMQRSRAGSRQIREAVQASAHEEIVKLQGGIQVLDVVIVVAPLLGLLGTASGITTVFDGLSSVEDVKMAIMAQGVAEALSTTIAGLAVAVPAVIGHSVFNRKIETYASQLEVSMEALVGAVQDSQSGEAA